MAKKDSNLNPVGKSRGLGRKGGGVADWSTANGAAVVRAISTAAAAGGALRFGYTSDGGAYSVGIYGDGSPYTEYLKPGEDLDEFLQSIVDLFESIADDLKRAKSPE
jgi:hypothetical protein